MIEQQKYEEMWKHPSYRAVAPGEHVAPKLLEVASPKTGQTVRDLGCGTGRGGAALAAAGLEVTQYDFATNCRDPDIDLPFVQHDLLKPIAGLPADYAFGCVYPGQGFSDEGCAVCEAGEVAVSQREKIRVK